MKNRDSTHEMYEYTRVRVRVCVCVLYQLLHLYNAPLPRVI